MSLMTKLIDEYDHRRPIEEIEARIDELDERHSNFSEKERMSIDGISLVLRMSELQWTLGR